MTILTIILNILCAICWSVNAVITRDKGTAAFYVGLSILWWAVAIMNIIQYLA